MKHYNRPKPDDRSNNPERIQRTIDNTKKNIELANEMMEKVGDEQTKRALAAKNQRRAQTIPELEKEKQEEQNYRKKNSDN